MSPRLTLVSSWGGAFALLGCGGSSRSVAAAEAGAPDAAASDAEMSEVQEASTSDVGAPDAGDASAVGVLDCAWLAGDASCFHASLAAAAQDCPINAPEGMLSADRTKCTFSNGAVVTFATPFPLDAAAPLPDFSVETDGGGPCLSAAFLANGGRSITTSAGTTSVEVDPSTETVTLTCPDGTRYSGAGASVSPCDFPGISIGGPVDIIIQLAGTGMAIEPTIFTCHIQ
jgi:hypothetical protein